MPNEPGSLSHASPAVLELYHDLIKAIEPLGPFKTEIKKSSVHFVRNSAFACVHFRKSHILLTVTAGAHSGSPRVMKSEQVSANRWHWDLKVLVNGDIDGELMQWLRAAYELYG